MGEFAARWRVCRWGGWVVVAVRLGDAVALLGVAVRLGVAARLAGVVVRLFRVGGRQLLVDAGRIRAAVELVLAGERRLRAVGGQLLRVAGGQ